jgi:hypothetical protein
MRVRSLSSVVNTVIYIYIYAYICVCVCVCVCVSPYLKSKSPHFAHSLHFCVPYDSQNKRWFLSNSNNRLIFVIETCFLSGTDSSFTYFLDEVQTSKCYIHHVQTLRTWFCVSSLVVTYIQYTFKLRHCKVFPYSFVRFGCTSRQTSQIKPSF